MGCSKNIQDVLSGTLASVGVVTAAARQERRQAEPGGVVWSRALGLLSRIHFHLESWVRS